MTIATVITEARRMRSGDGLPRGRPRLQLFCDRLALSKYLWGVPFPLPDVFIDLNKENQPIRLPGLKPGAGLPSPGPGKAGAGLPSPGPGKAGAGVCSGLILSGAFYPDLKIGVWRRRTYQWTNPTEGGASAGGITPKLAS